ncbi:hypothetical protein RO575_20030 [Methylomonas sp. MO1]|uniref:hypothetical protein n=1 Tax=Methylomonas sp. MO1 TaxID=3073619 RepID=UPI0028A322C0|nr:hypothetical protein [Methylomonas sp. MO1]MDT4291860.1 hypothetical protein [Methylomonas sp. MO1]
MVIHESHYWKAPLVRAAGWLNLLRVNDKNSEAALARAEREIFIGFYAIRKLLSTFKLSESTKQLKYEIEWFPGKPGRAVDYFNRSEIDELFDLNQKSVETRDIGFLCNQVVHSFIFIITLGEKGELEGFFLTSDTMRYRRLYFVSIGSVLHAFRTVGKDYPSKQSLKRNEETGQWEAFDGEP